MVPAREAEAGGLTHPPASPVLSTILAVFIIPDFVQVVKPAAGGLRRGFSRR